MSLLPCISPFLAPVMGVLLLSACGDPSTTPTMPPVVGVLRVAEEAVTLTTELPGRIVAYETSHVRPQVSGIILKRLFREGETVRAGQPLYQIDPAPYEVQAANARAALTRAQASINAVEALARRYGELVKINAVGEQDFEDAEASAGQARADVVAQRALLDAAELDVRRTRITAPISGRIGRSVYTTGALVTASQADALATIQRLDPIFVDINESSVELLRLRKQILAGEISRDDAGNARVRLKLEDGSDYELQGTLQFSDVTVDRETGSVSIRAIFRNPQGLLLPGMYVRAELIEGQQSRAILAPQQAVSRDEKGNPVVLVVGAGNRIEQRVITAPRTIGTNWLVTAGLKPGDRIVMDGAQYVQPGVTVKPVTWKPQQTVSADKRR